MASKEYITIPQLARLLGLNRVTVYKKVKRGEIPSTKVGKFHLISRRDVERILEKRLTKQDKARIEIAVKRTVQEYGDVLKWLSKE